ncbi:MAG TPA: hypothetical protein GX706_01865 [Candidatus Moranbacteria bacterium]|nr:hypothetical protein [Candidatus Moranbacteria bacterium]
MKEEIKKKVNLTEVLKCLEEITNWFDSQEEVDVEVGLKKVKDGAILIKAGKARLKEVENEFEDIKKALETE